MANCFTPMIPADAERDEVSANEMPTSAALTGCSANEFGRTEEEYNSTSRFGQHVTNSIGSGGLLPVHRRAATPHAAQQREELAPAWMPQVEYPNLTTSPE